MGLRFNKSIKLPFGLRLNISKSGIGFSWGVKGYRVGKTAKGKVRQTVSIPGTGLSYVKESGLSKNKNTTSKVNQKETHSTKLKEVYLNEETGEIIEKGNAKVKEIKTFDDIVEDVADKVGNIIDK